jgi:hypothetical protein
VVHAEESFGGTTHVVHAEESFGGTTLMWCMLRSRSWPLPVALDHGFHSADDKSVVAPYGLTAAKSLGTNH